MIVVVDYQKGNIRSVARGLEAAGAQVVVSQDADAIARADAIVLPGVGAFADAMQTITELGQDDAMREAVGRGVPFLGICLGLHLMFAAGDEHAEGNAPTPGLGLIPGIVRHMPRTGTEGTPYKIPHVGWNTVCLLEGGSGGVGRSDGAATGESEGAAIGGSEGVHQASSARAGMSSGHSERARTAERLDAFAPTLTSPHESAACPLFDGIGSGEHFYFTHSYIAPESDATIATTTHSVTFPCAVQQGAAFGVQFHPEKSSDAGQRLLANFVRFARKA